VTITANDLQRLAVLDTRHSFKGDGRLLRLGLQAYALDIAYEFDPYFGLSISRVDPLPHQLEATYDYLLKLARVRFLLADDAGAGKTIMSGLLIRKGSASSRGCFLGTTEKAKRDCSGAAFCVARPRETLPRPSASEGETLGLSAKCRAHAQVVTTLLPLATGLLPNSVGRTATGNDKGTRFPRVFRTVREVRRSTKRTKTEFQDRCFKAGCRRRPTFGEFDRMRRRMRRSYR
jgi:hypothetical protein